MTQTSDSITVVACLYRFLKGGTKSDVVQVEEWGRRCEQRLHEIAFTTDPCLYGTANVPGHGDKDRTLRATHMYDQPTSEQTG